MSEQKKQNLANSSVRKDLLLICLTEKLSENGYRINVLDISDPKHSEKYNRSILKNITRCDTLIVMTI